MEPASLAEYPFFQGLDEPLLRRLAACGRDAHFDAEEFVFRAGEPADSLYVIREGAISLEVYTPHRPVLPVHILGPGDLLGWSWLIPPFQWHFDARALQPTRMIAFEGRCLREAFDQDHELGYQLLVRFFPIVVQRLQATRMQLLELYETGSGV